MGYNRIDDCHISPNSCEIQTKGICVSTEMLENFNHTNQNKSATNDDNNDNDDDDITNDEY